MAAVGTCRPEQEPAREVGYGRYGAPPLTLREERPRQPRLLILDPQALQHLLECAFGDHPGTGFSGLGR